MTSAAPTVRGESRGASDWDGAKRSGAAMAVTAALCTRAGAGGIKVETACLTC
jgi:hypothetical protein